MSYSRPTVHVYLRNFVSIGLFCRPVAAKNSNFCRFLEFGISWCTGIAGWRQSEKVEHGCTTTNLPLSGGVKIVSVLAQRFLGEIVRAISDVQKHDGQKRDGQTNKQTKTQSFLATPPAGEIRAQSSLAR